MSNVEEQDSKIEEAFAEMKRRGVVIDKGFFNAVESFQRQRESYKRIMKVMISINRNLCDVINLHVVDEDALDLAKKTIQVMEQTEFDLEDL